MIKWVDLAIACGRKRQSSRTGFVHQDDTIPLYENFCFALALFRQKTIDSVTEGKELIERLIAFQTPDGSFPVYLHEFPKAHDYQMLLKVAPIFIYLLRHFSPVLGPLAPKLENLLKGLRRPEKPFWENRYRACVNEPLLPMDTASFSPSEWTEWMVTAQLAGQTHFSLPFDPKLQLFIPSSHVQEMGEPRPHPIEWLLAEGNYSPRLLKDHPQQIYTALLSPVTFTPVSSESRSLFWQGTTLHSFFASAEIFDLPEGVEMGRGDLMEASAFVDISPETEIFVEGKKATAFSLGDTVTIKTPSKTINLQFELVSGLGDFCGHIRRGNRPSQIANKGANQYEAYDWQIGVRTLRRSGFCQIRLVTSDCLAVDSKSHGVHAVIDVENSSCNC